MKLRKDTELLHMMDEGWKWTVIDSSIDEEFPMFAGIVQHALNANNHVAQRTGELEVMMQMLESVTDDTVNQNFKGDELKKIVVDSVRRQGLPCSGYAGQLCDFCTKYGGGKGGPAQAKPIEAWHKPRLVGLTGRSGGKSRRS